MLSISAICSPREVEPRWQSREVPNRGDLRRRWGHERNTCWREARRERERHADGLRCGHADGAAPLVGKGEGGALAERKGGSLRGIGFDWSDD